MLLILIYLTLLLTCVLIIFYAERKLASFIQDRLGPMQAGPYGLLQAVADLLKMIQKEDIIPINADKVLFKLAPFVIFAVVFMGLSVIPLGPNLIASSSKMGVFFVIAIISLDVVGLIMAGYGSGNKYALLGAMRSLAQIISYEIPVGLSVLAVVIACGTIDLQAICYQQNAQFLQSAGEKTYLFGISALGDVSSIGGILTWNIVKSPILIIAYIIFFIGTLAECNRAPFDIPEAESELIAGFHVEYSGFRFAIFFLSEYGMMLLVSLLGAILFLGGWSTPFPNIGFLKLADWTNGDINSVLGKVLGCFWLVSKALIAMLVHIWIRWTFPRLRMDQLMNLCWKYLTPFGIGCVFVAAYWRLLGV